MTHNQDAPSQPTDLIQLVDPKTGRLTTDGLELLNAGWRHYVAGYVVVPCEASGKNAIILTPELHEEGAATYAEGMSFTFSAEQTSDGAVTIALGSLDVLKAYITNGSVQAGTGDLVAGLYYLGIYVPTLDAGNGGIVIW